MVKVFEKPLHPGWVYPCTVEEIEQQLLTFPPEDLEGLATICLAPVLRRDLEDRGVDGRYCRSRATIYLFGWPVSLAYKYPKGWKRHHVESNLVVERSFGMQVEQIGRRWYCRWERENWRRFMLEHVLAHEIGHHVCGLSEQLAEEYALRRYAERYMRENPGGEWSHSSFEAGLFLLGWFRSMWENRRFDHKSVIENKAWLARFYKEGDDGRRLMLVQATLEHLFEDPGIADYFSDWQHDPILKQAYDDAMARAFRWRERQNREDLR